MVFVKPVKENGVVYGVECGGEIQEGEGCDKLFSHIEEKIILNIKMMYYHILSVCCANFTL